VTDAIIVKMTNAFLQWYIILTCLATYADQVKLV